MPIKACTRCGLKVLVDATAAASDTYLCPRCAPDAKPASSPPPKSGGKRPSVKVTCPYCGASFSGSMPSRPAKGGCPVCQKELILLPDGTIQAAATFNLAAWQKERDRKTPSNPPSVPVAPVEPAPELPSTPDPLGGSTILDMGGPPGGAPPAPLPSLDDQTMAMPPPLGGESMLGMGSGMPEPPPVPTLDESPPPPPEEPVRDEEPPELPSTADPLGGATILDMGSRPVDLPEPAIEEPPAPPPPDDLLSEAMPGMDRPPAAESPVEPPIPPPVPEEPPVDVTEEPTIRDEEVPAPHEPSVPLSEPETSPSLESAPEIPSELGGETILGMGGPDDLAPPPPAPAPSIEEPAPEAVPILANDVPLPGAAAPDSEAEPQAPPGEEPEGPEPYVYQPIPRKSRVAPAPPPPAPAAPAPPSHSAPLPGSPSTPPPSGAPVLGSDFRISAPPPPPKETFREERKPAAPRPSAALLPRAEHGLGKLIFAWSLLLVPVVIVFLLHTFQKNASVEGTLKKVTEQAKPGIDKMRGEIEKAVKAKPEGAPAESK